MCPAIGTGVDCFRGLNFGGNTALENKKLGPELTCEFYLLDVFLIETGKCTLK